MQLITSAVTFKIPLCTLTTTRQNFSNHKETYVSRKAFAVGGHSHHYHCLNMVLDLLVELCQPLISFAVLCLYRQIQSHFQASDGHMQLRFLSTKLFTKPLVGLRYVASPSVGDPGRILWTVSHNQVVGQAALICVAQWQCSGEIMYADVRPHVPSAGPRLVIEVGHRRGQTETFPCGHIYQILSSRVHPAWSSKHSLSCPQVVRRTTRFAVFAQTANFRGTPLKSCGLQTTTH